MKKLGKKNCEVIETVEAYEDICYALENCYDKCTGAARKSLNNRLFNAAHKGA
ncbi:CLI_3235 family bacteriocin precursor [Clostridium sp. CMCC3677]|uniref:CLI_3235 family bacteriocin precursor n=1 Tax=Clostridium sp. CMCC3677 TaxID=2949963 RepID=UPI0013F0D4B9|nr:CLI_3235 family bacteriocin precursor [Clostridium sp. CMCC3677]NFG63091.1 putative bacteriocin precursor [Clostridium botulinum]NFQ08021.1 putative bacteriocin precursor [Clostridium botulinum]